MAEGRVTTGTVHVLCSRACAMLLVSSAALSAQATRPDAPGEPQAPAPRITEVAANPKLVAVLAQQPVTVSFTTNTPGDGELAIFDQWRRVARRIVLGNLPAGKHEVVWDGHDDRGGACRGGRFTYTIRLTDDAGRTAIYDPSSDGAGLEVKTRRFTFDKATGKLEYVLPRPCMVRVRVGLRDGPLMRTVVDWEAQLAGPHLIAWDGLDASGGIRLIEHPDLNINLVAYALPLNVILVSRDAADVNPGRLHAAPTLGEPARRNEGSRYLHASCNPTTCHEPRFSIAFPGASHVRDGMPTVSGRTPLRIAIAPADVAQMVSKRFEVMFYVDGVFVFEEEDGTSPLTYQWDTSGLAPGRHQVTVNIMSYDDHVGTVTSPVMVRKTK